MKHPGDRKFFNVDFLCLYLAVHGPVRAYRARHALSAWKTAQDGKQRGKGWYSDYFSDDISPCRYAAPNAGGSWTSPWPPIDAQLWQRRRDLDRHKMGRYGSYPTQAHWELTPRGVDRAFLAAVKARRQGIDVSVIFSQNA